jgi:hypothetical protein
VNRRDFIKSVAAASVLGACGAVSGVSADHADDATPLSNIRLVAVGGGAWGFLEDHLFNSCIHPALGLGGEEIMFIDHSGRVIHAPRPNNQPALVSRLRESMVGVRNENISGNGCEDMEGISLDRIAEFIGKSDWVFIVSSVDNGFASAACDAVVTVCNNSGVRALALVATPYYWSEFDQMGPFAEFMRGDGLLGRLQEKGIPVILERGFWAGEEGEELGWHWKGQDVALGMLVSALHDRHHSRRMEQMIAKSSQLICAWGGGLSAREAIQDAVDAYSISHELSGRALTAGGAVIRLSCHPSQVGMRRSMILSELSRPEQFEMDGAKFWRERPEFIVIDDPDERYGRDGCFSLNVLSIGVEIRDRENNQVTRWIG